MPAAIVENVIVGVVTSIVTAFAVWAWTRVRALRALHRKAAFFGISPGESCLILTNHAAENPEVVTQNDVEVLVETSRLADAIGATSTIARFDRVLEPAGDTAEFCIGGPASNERSGVHLKTYLPGVRFTAWTEGSADAPAILAGGEVYPYRSTELEHAVLARFYPDASARPVILICGQSSRANRAAIHYLTTSYDTSLRRSFGNDRPFCLILKIESPLVYGVKSVRLTNDVTATAFAPAETPTVPSASVEA
jgi:hypothetical protein